MFPEPARLSTADKPKKCPIGPHDVAALTTFKTDFDNARAAQVDAGPSATAAKNNFREILVDALREDAADVELQANNDKAVLLNSGYQAARALTARRLRSSRWRSSRFPTRRAES